MKPKKSPQADVDKKIGNFFLIGLSISIAVVIVAFEWRFYEQSEYELTSDLVIEEDEEIADITKQQKKPPPPPPPPEIEVVEDDVEIEDDQPEIEEVDIDVEETVDLPPAEEEEEGDEEEIFLVVEQQPEFPGGTAAMMNYINKEIEYPSMEKENGISGLVVVNFIVDENGNITNPKVVKSVTPGLDKEALRVVKSMPNWKPGKQRGQSVKVSMNLPIRFSLK